MVGSGGWVTIHIGGKSLLYLPVGIVPSGNSTSGKGLSEKKGLTCVTYWMTNMCNLLNECLWTGQQKTAWLNDWIVWSRSDWFFELALLWAISPLNNLFFSPQRPWGLQDAKAKQRFTHFLLLPFKKSQYWARGTQKDNKSSLSHWSADPTTSYWPRGKIGDLLWLGDLKVDWRHFSIGSSHCGSNYWAQPNTESLRPKKHHSHVPGWRPVLFPISNSNC